MTAQTGFKPSPQLSRRGAVAPFLAMDVMEAARIEEANGASIIHMEVGQPSTPPPDCVLDAARDVLASGRIGYTVALGLPDLRQRIARHYAETYQVAVPWERVAVTTGSSAGFNLAFLTAFDAGDRIAIASPGYPAYRNILKALGLEVVEIQTGPGTRYALTAEMIAAEHARKPLKGVLVASPANPSGTIMTPEALKALVETCDDLGLWFISDEIYHGLAYEAGDTTALSFSDKVIIINSFSKYYCMTGWRIGWMILPEALLRSVECVAQSLYISAPEVSQRAAIAAFDAPGVLEGYKAVYAKNRALLLERMPKIGFDDYLPADGAFYFYANIARFSDDSMDFAKRMLKEARVAATPGPDFDTATGHHYMRFSFAGSHADMVEAMERLERWLGS